jgi:hypothetical protein
MRLIAIAAAMAITATVQAVGLQQYKHFMDGSLEEQETNRVYIAGVGSGLSWANARLQREGRQPLYCPPRNLMLNGYNYEQMVVEQDRKYELLPTYPVALMLMDELMETFPCEESEQ